MWTLPCSQTQKLTTTTKHFICIKILWGKKPRVKNLTQKGGRGKWGNTTEESSGWALLTKASPWRFLSYNDGEIHGFGGPAGHTQPGDTLHLSCVVVVDSNNGKSSWSIRLCEKGSKHVIFNLGFELVREHIEPLKVSVCYWYYFSRHFLIGRDCFVFPFCGLVTAKKIKPVPTQKLRTDTPGSLTGKNNKNKDRHSWLTPQRAPTRLHTRTQTHTLTPIHKGSWPQPCRNQAGTRPAIWIYFYWRFPNTQV